MSRIIPISRVPVSIRLATMSDYAFIDRLQGMHSKNVGFMRKEELEGKIRAGNVLIAEDEARLPIGYCIAQDRYFKRDDCGVVYQMNVAPGSQRKLVAATLLKAVFDRAAYGCRLFSCWCAQDLDANYFWESMGFVPLAFRTGAISKKKVRTHIFWQKRIREGDETTPYWYPCKTDGGHLRADRIVLPMLPGVKWSDAMPVLLPADRDEACPGATKTPRSRVMKSRMLQFGPPGSSPIVASPAEAPAEQSAKPPGSTKLGKPKVDPVLLAKARELRDRWLEQVNSGQYVLEAVGKYDVARRIEAATIEPRLLEAA